MKTVVDATQNARDPRPETRNQHKSGQSFSHVVDKNTLLKIADSF